MFYGVSFFSNEKQLVTVQEFCHFTGLDFDHVRRYITG